MFHLRVTLDGREPVEVEADSRDIVRWEALGKGRHFGALESALRMTDLSELAWFALEREGSVSELPDRPTFLRAVKVVPFKPDDEDGESEGGELDPGRADR